MTSLFRKRKNSKRNLPIPVTVDEGDTALPSASESARRTDRSPSLSTSPCPPATNSLTTTFADLGLRPPLVVACRKLGFARPTAVQRAIIPMILDPSSRREGGDGGRQRRPHHLLTLSATGSGKTAAFALPLLQVLSSDPYGIFALVLTPTRELAKQIQQQILALGSGSGWRVTCALVIGGEDATRQGLELGKQPNFVVATPGRLAELCRDEHGGGGLYRPNFRKVRFVVLDEADRLLCAGSGFERDVAECLLQSTTAVWRDDCRGEGGRVRRDVCRTLLFSATMTRSLTSLEELAGVGIGRLPLKKVVVRDDGTWDNGELRNKAKKQKCSKNEKKTDKPTGSDDVRSEGDDEGVGSLSENSIDSEESDGGSTPNIPAGLRQEYVFMPSRVREAYLLCAVRALMIRGGRSGSKRGGGNSRGSSGWNATEMKNADISELLGNNDGEDEDGDRTRSKYPLARSAIIFVPTCERCAHVSGILTELGIRNVALHSLLSQGRRLASLGTFQSQRARVLVATDVASRGLDVPEVDLVINAELPRRTVDYVHRVGRTARAGRRGRAVSLVGEGDVDLVHEAERISGRILERCEEVTDDMAVRLLGPVSKASRLTKMKLMDIGFDELVQKHRDRKRRDRRRREKAESRARKAMAKVNER